MSRISEYLDRRVDQHRARTDPISRFPWWTYALFAVVLAALGLARVATGSGTSQLFGVLLLLVVPAQLVSAYVVREAGRRPR